jgi:NAD+ kinase
MCPDSPAASPSPRIGRVGLVAKRGLQEASGHLLDIASWLDARGVGVVFERETAALAGTDRQPQPDRDSLPSIVDMILVLGGDGTLLAMADRIAATGTGIPILGVNFGSLGFLTEITLPELYPSLEATLAGRARIDRRLMLRAATARAGKPFQESVALNDVVITKGALSRIIALSIWVDDDFVTDVRADGLIIASATGSTAYNLAANGPIMHPAVDALLLTPIAPHTLTNRPVVIPGGSRVRIQPAIDHTSDEVYLTFDGQTGFRLEAGDVVTVHQAERPLRLVRASTRTYFQILRQKLRWGER